jgi:hypothetical protein
MLNGAFGEHASGRSIYSGISKLKQGGSVEDAEISGH